MEGNKTIDLNCDLGEGYPHDKDIFPLISSANIACGGHAGDKESITACLELCERYEVAAGAHPSYPNKKNFGRLSMQMERISLQDSIRMQLDLFSEMAIQSNIPVHHIKLHGALYNDCSVKEELAGQVLEVMKEYDIPFIYGLSGSRFNRLAAAQGFRVIDEVFADRAYMPDGQLAPRSMPGAVLADTKTINEQLTSILTLNETKSINGETTKIKAGTVCLHGDTPGAGEFIKEIRNLIIKLNFYISCPV